ncbi:MAG: hypothetical protein V3U40_06720, partial [Candidatus Scalindua sediminis]
SYNLYMSGRVNDKSESEEIIIELIALLYPSLIAAPIPSFFSLTITLILPYFLLSSSDAFAVPSGELSSTTIISWFMCLNVFSICGMRIFMLSFSL